MLWIGLLAVSAVAVCVLFLNVAKKRNHKR
jgi:hypothetical protein